MIHILIGTRAQLIKMLPVMDQLQKKQIPYNFIFMAQHHETIYEIIDQFSLKRPDYTIGDIGTDVVKTGQMVLWSIRVLIHGIIQRKKIFGNDKKGIVLIHGDAPPLLLGALISKFQGLKVGSVEAGLRSFNLLKPFPEELTRVLTAKLRLIDYYFCQDEKAMDNVSAYHGEAVNTNGNTIYDTIALADSQENATQQSEQYAVVTIHRFETITKPEKLTMVVEKVIAISSTIKLLFILHPPTKVALKNSGLYEKLEHAENITLLPRMGFLDFNLCIKGAEFIISDGGSNQEESAYLGIPCLLFRNESERSEGIGKNVVLSKFDDELISHFIDNYQSFRNKTVLEGNSPTQIILDKVSIFA